VYMNFLLYMIFSLLLNVSYSRAADLPIVDYVDLDRYLGKWYEISSLPQSFQKGCTATMAEYSMRGDGDIKVLNSCRLNSPDGKLKEAEGRAWVKDKKTKAKLKVQFFLKEFKFFLFAGNYWILDIDKNYESVLVGEKSRKYLWILSRKPFLSSKRYDELVLKAESLGFDTSKLVKTIH